MDDVEVVGPVDGSNLQFDTTVVAADPNESVGDLLAAFGLVVFHDIQGMRSTDAVPARGTSELDRLHRDIMPNTNICVNYKLGMGRGSSRSSRRPARRGRVVPHRGVAEPTITQPAGRTPLRLRHPDCVFAVSVNADGHRKVEARRNEFGVEPTCRAP